MVFVQYANATDLTDITALLAELGYETTEIEGMTILSYVSGGN